MPTYNDSSLTYDAGTTSYDGAPGAIAGLPQATIEIAFDDGPYVWEPYWTDVTEYVRSVNVRRGRNDDLSPFVGTASVELDNRDRRFDPFNTSGVYYGKLLPRRQIRIRAAAGANTYDVFRGYVAGWPTSYTEAGFDATVSLDCFDALAFLASEDTPDTWLSEYLTALNPAHYYKLTDPITSITAYSGVQALPTPIRDSGTERLDLTLFLDNPRSQARILPSGGDALNVMNGRVDVVGGPIGTFGSYSMSAFMQVNAQSGTTFLASDQGQGEITYNILSTPDELVFSATINSTATGNRYITVARVLSDSDVIHVGLTYNASTDTLTAYINGRQASGTLATRSGTLGTLKGVLLSNGVFSNVIYTKTVLTAAQMLAIYELGFENIQEQVPSRITRLFRQTPFPEITSPSTDFRVWEAPLATQFVQGLNSDTPINNELTSLSSSEGGELFCARDGVIYLTGRDTQNYSSPFLPYEPCIVQATFSDAAGTALPYGPTLDVEWDADGIINDLSLTFTGGGNVTASDATSISANGKRSQTISTQLTGPTGAGSPQDLADLRVEYFRHVIPRVSPLDVGMTRDLTDWQTLLSLELMDAFAVQRTPSVGSALDFRLQVQAIDHQIVPGDWRMRVTGSARYANWFTADVDDADGARLAV